MRLSNVYKKASERIVLGKNMQSCVAIMDVTGLIQNISLDNYKELFTHHKSEENGWWCDEFTPENQLTRSLALLFMAEIAKENE